MSDIPEAGMGAMVCGLYTFDSCLRFHVAYDTHDMCAPCRHKEGHQECTRDSNCQYCINWSDIECSLYERNLQQKGKMRQKKLDKNAASVSLEDSLAVDPEDLEDTTAEESEMEDSGSQPKSVD